MRSEAAQAGAQQLVVAGAPWTAGQALLIADAPSSDAFHSEVVAVAAVRSGSGQVTLAAPLRHSHAAGTTVSLLSRSIAITSLQYADGGSSIKIAPPSADLLEVVRPTAAPYAALLPRIPLPHLALTATDGALQSFSSRQTGSQCRRGSHRVLLLRPHPPGRTPSWTRSPAACWPMKHWATGSP